MLTLYDNANTAKFIRPCPLINITWNGTNTADGIVGGKYDIVLTGTLISYKGSPIYNNQATPLGFHASVNVNQHHPSGEMLAIVLKQQALQNLFSDVKKIEVAGAQGSNTVCTFYPKVVSINFAESVWVDRCDYTVTLEAPFLIDKQLKIIGPQNHTTRLYNPTSQIMVGDIISNQGGFIEDFQETWSIEPEDGFGNTVDPYAQAESIVRIYRLTRNITAKGQDLTTYGRDVAGGNDPEQYRAFEQARKFIQKYTANSGNMFNDFDDYPATVYPNTVAYFAKGLLDLSSAIYGGYNHSRNENFDISQGTYSMQDTWILSSGNSYENYNLSISLSEGSTRNKVTIEGSIKGLTAIPASGNIYGGSYLSTMNTPYENAMNQFRTISSSGNFGFTSWTYKRAQHAAGGITLNDTPASIAISTNEIAGEINYTVEYDDRPRNFIQGVNFESVSITDTYPGDVFAVIPVIGRPTGPVLQYIGGRTEYQRNLSIELIVPSQRANTDNSYLTDPNYAQRSHRQGLLLKPSLVSPTREGILNIINAYSPGREPGIRKYFVSPPQETWDAKEGRYTLNITWTYELSY